MTYQDSVFDSGVLSWACVIALLIVIGIVISESIQQIRLTFYGVKTNATCVRIETVGIGRSTRLSYTFRYTNEAGTAIEVKDIWCTEGTKEGDVIPIVYLPTDPEVVSLSGMKGWGFLLFTGTLGILLCLFILQWFR